MIKIPKAVKVGAMVYTVTIVPDMHAKRELYGEVNYNHQTIEIAGDINEARQFNAFLHELTHAILFEAGDMSDQDEAYVRRFSNTLTQVAKANDWTLGGAPDGEPTS